MALQDEISNSVSQRDSLNATSTAGFWITVNQYAVQPNITSSSVEPIWHAGQESCQHLIFFHPDNTVVRTTHTNVCLIGGSIRQHTRIRCRDVSMGTENSGHSSIQVPAHGDLFGGCLRMHIYKNDLRLRLRQQAIGGAEGTIVLYHEYSTLQVHHSVGNATPGGAFIVSAAGRGCGIIGRPQDTASG